MGTGNPLPFGVAFRTVSGEENAWEREREKENERKSLRALTQVLISKGMREIEKRDRGKV